ncbi:glycosyltransferase [Marinilabilia sp.]|uniref:glycosyltransferase n=1 Tax=Marinilabilia sp. TaxID=2021252 RepID=UPI0025BB31D6|nr:glycosyltransferase [Marinilabilia sp.]
MMNIALINSIGKNKWGGGEKWMIMTASGLKALGHNVLIVCRKNSVLSRRAKAENLSVKEIGANSDFDIIACWRFCRFFKEFQPKAVIGCQNKDWRVASVALKIIGADAKVYSRQGLQLLKNHWWYKWTVKLFCDGIITNTHTIKKEYESFLPVKKDFIKVIFNGVEELQEQGNFFDFSPWISAEVKNPVIVLSTGRLARQKGFKFLVEAARYIVEQHDNVFFFLAGKGRLESQLLKLIRKYNLEKRFFLIGFQEDISGLLRAADIFVIPSLYEGMPNSVLEAMSYKLPVVASNVNGVSELIKDGENGFSIKSGDVAQLVDKLNVLISDGGKRMELGEKGHFFVKDNFSIDRMVQEFDRFIKGDAENRRPKKRMTNVPDGLSFDMRIAYDAKRVYHNFTGLGNYSRDLIRILKQFFPRNQYLLYNPKASKKHVFDVDNKHVVEIRPKGKFFKLFPSVWRQFKIVNDLKRDGVKLFHGLSGEIPTGLKQHGIKSMVTVHDLIFLRFPKFYSFFDREIHTIKARHSTRNADVVVAVSEQTKNDVVEFFGVDPSKIRVIYQGCQDIYKQKFPAEEIERVRKKYNLPEQYLLNVGTIEERKNILLGVKAIKDLDTHLAIVGSETEYTSRVKEYILHNEMGDKVSFLKGVPNDELAMLYQGASLFVYPSLFEGFGIPIIEALFSDTPVVTSKGGCFGEAGGAGSLYIDPFSVEELKDAIVKVLTDSALRERLVVSGREHVKKFSDEFIADQYMALYRSLLLEK